MILARTPAPSAPGDALTIGLVNEGTYPVVHGGVSTWCDQLIRGVAPHRFALVTLVGADRGVSWDLPGNVESLTLAPMWDEVAPARGPRARGERRRAVDAMRRLWAAVLPPTGEAEPRVDAVEDALRALVAPRRHTLMSLLVSGAGTDALVEAYGAHARVAGLPALSLGEAARAHHLAIRTLGVVDVRWPRVDVAHAAANGPSGLVALARLLRDGTPYLLTEHGVYLRERYLGLGAMGLPWATRYASMMLTRALCRLVYRKAALMAPVSDFNGAWMGQAGADLDRTVTIYNGVDPARYAPVEGEPDVPTVSWFGRVDPLKDLHTLIEAFALVAPRVPGSRLRMFGPVPKGNEEYHADLERLIASRALAGRAVFEPPVPCATPAVEAGHVVALSSISEGLPFSVIESMMSARATVSTDVGGVAEVVGDDGESGLVVPPADPAAMADALVALLTDDARRHAMAASARERALGLFDLSLFSQRYAAAYDATRDGRRAPRDRWAHPAAPAEPRILAAA